MYGEVWVGKWKRKKQMWRMLKNNSICRTNLVVISAVFEQYCMHGQLLSKEKNISKAVKKPNLVLIYHHG